MAAVIPIEEYKRLKRMKQSVFDGFRDIATAANNMPEDEADELAIEAMERPRSSLTNEGRARLKYHHKYSTLSPRHMRSTGGTLPDGDALDGPVIGHLGRIPTGYGLP
jgi:hypothetical protein